ncbi:MAG: response regulator [Balneolaceae bacterium]
MSNKRSICIIDDDKVYTFGIKKIINNHLPGNTVTTYENGKLALERLREMNEAEEAMPDFILLDIDMPEMNGWDFLKEFDELRKSIKKKVEIFVISSRIESNNENLYQVEWDDKVSKFIPKPINIERLKEILN